MDFTAIKEICDYYGAEFLMDTPIASYTSFKIGGKCNIIKINRVEVLSKLLIEVKKNSIPFHILGRGSNVLISDKGLEGVVLLIGDSFNKLDVIGDMVTCQAGARLSDICKAAAVHSLTGIEFAYGIPGTVGGAVCMNAGAYDGEMAHVVESCGYLDGENRDESIVMVGDMKLSYRNSIFCGKKCENKDKVITRVTIRLKHGSRVAIKERMDEITAMRKEKQPLEFPSAGSTFKRPDGYFAAKLIDDCGLKGKTIGGAQVSEKHAGFIINKGNATCYDVINLINLIKEEVYSKTKVSLETEVKIWNS
jgi:UDP-N-acetylmuramate dehydrogenase